MRAALLVAVLASCQGAPPLAAADQDAILTEAEHRLAATDPRGCRDLLLSLGRQAFPRSLQPRYELALARAHASLGELWEAFLVLRGFADDHPHSDLRDQVVDLQFQIGSALTRSDHGFLFFWSDARAGRTVLEHLITRYPDTTHLADALRILGEMAFADGDHDGAMDRFREILKRRPESEWVPLARFRFAMSIVASLRGPEYDLDQMQQATKELRDFLANPPENPEFVREAEATLQRLLRWQSERHLLVATFYADIGNRAGEVEHLRAANAPEFAATEAAAKARQRLAALGESEAGGAR